MHNAKPHRPGSKYNADKKAGRVDPNHYLYLKFPAESPVQPGDRVEYMDEDEQLMTGSVLEEGAYLMHNVLYVRVEFEEYNDAVPAASLTKIFDYEALDAETRIVVQQKTGEIKSLMRRAAQDIIDIGGKLIEVKAKLGHGGFGKWLDAEFGWTDRTARNFMHVATAFKSETVSDLNIGAKALYLLAAPSTPEEARAEAIERAEAGEFVTHAVAKAIVTALKPQPPVPPAPQPGKAYEQATRVFEPAVRPPAVTYGKSEDDYVDDVPSTDADDPDWLDEALAGKEEVKPSPVEPVTFGIGDKVETIFGRKDGEVINLDTLMGIQVKFPGGIPWWIKADGLVLVERATAVPVVAEPIAKPVSDTERARRAASKEQSAQRQLAKNDIPADWSTQSAWRVKEGDLIEASADILDNSIDIIITDPPYSKQYLDLYTKLSVLAARVLKPGGSLICMTGQICLPDVMAELGRHLTYHWTLSYVTLSGKSPQIWPRKVNTFWKPLLWYVKGEFEGDWIGDVVRGNYSIEDKALHEWGQSVEGFLDIVKRFTYPDDLIFDPFMGAGTTGVAALQSHRRFIGIDVDAEAVSAATLRLSEFSNGQKSEVVNG